MTRGEDKYEVDRLHFSKGGIFMTSDDHLKKL